MSKHGYAVGDMVVKRTDLGGHTYFRFGLVEKATPTTVKVQIYDSKILESQGDGSYSSSHSTCTFEWDQRVEGEVETFRWLRSMEEMGQRMDGSLCSCRLEHFDKHRKYNSVAY
jgi:hypothetical protein